MAIEGFLCGPRLYEYDGWFFEVSIPSGPWPLKKDGELRKRAGDKFYSMFERFDNLSDEEKEKHRAGGGCVPLGLRVIKQPGHVEGEEKTFKVCAKITMDVVTEVQAGPGTGIHPDDDEAIRKEAISQIFEENYDPGPLDCDPKVQWVEEDEG